MKLRKMQMAIYNKDKRAVERVQFPNKIELSEGTKRIFNDARNGNDPTTSKWSRELLSIAMLTNLEKCPTILPSGQIEGGFHIRANGVADTAFFECLYSDDGFLCHPRMNKDLSPRDDLGGFMYGSRRNTGCSEVYNRETMKVIPRGPGANPAFGYDSDTGRNLCAHSEEQIKEYERLLDEGIACVQDYDDMLRFSDETLRKIAPAAQWDARDTIRQTIQSETWEDLPELQSKWGIKMRKIDFDNDREWAARLMRRL